MNNEEKSAVLTFLAGRDMLNNLTAAAISSIDYVYSGKDSNRRRTRRWWLRDIFLLRDNQGHASNLVREIEVGDHESFYNFTRLSIDQFKNLLTIMETRLCKHSIRTPVSARDRLLVTLRFLATGDSYSSLSYAFRMGKSTIHTIIKETTEQLADCLFEMYVKNPTKGELKQIASAFFKKTGLPHCVGAIDGKHCRIIAPKHSGSLYFNYKHFFSIVILAVCDADCNFTYADIGAYGSESDGGILRRSLFGQRLANDTLDFPDDMPLPFTTTNFPFFIVGDEAFPLKKRLMRPYGGRTLSDDKVRFNECLSRARVTIERTFGILASRFRIFHSAMSVNPDVARNVIKSCVALHNFINKTNASRNMDLAQMSREQNNLRAIHQTSSNYFSSAAARNRNTLKDFINGR